MKIDIDSLIESVAKATRPTTTKAYKTLLANKEEVQKWILTATNTQENRIKTIFPNASEIWT